MDAVERDLIIKFFGVDPVNCVHPSNATYPLGVSTFSNILEFYKFEPQRHELQFWDILLPAVTKLPDKQLAIEMSRVNVGYDWLDYVTLVDIKYRIVYNTLVVHIQNDPDPYIQALVLICNMMFISDFCEVKHSYKHINTDKAWAELLQRTREYEQSLLH